MSPHAPVGDPDDPQAGVPDDVVALATALFDHARAGATAELAAYLDAGVPADLRNQAGDSLVMLAAYHGHAQTTEAVLARGADPNIANDKGQTPLAGAVFKGYDDVVAVLVAAGADPHAGAPSAHDAAVMFGRPDYLELWGPQRES